MTQQHRTRSRAFDRRTLVKGAVGAAAGATAMSAALAQASTGKAGFSVNLNQDGGEVVIYNNYVPFITEMAEKFTDATGIKVNQLATYSSQDEWWARLNAGEKFDFFIPAIDWFQRAMAADLLHEIDPAQVPNIKNLAPDYQANETFQKDGKMFSVPFTRVYYCMTYNTDTFAEAPDSWGVTWDEQYKGKITMMDSAQARVGTTALFIGDDPLNPTKWDEIRDKLMEQKDLVSKYWVDYQNGMEMFVNGEALVGQFTAGRTRMGKAEGGPIDWTVPKEGCLTFIDSFAIPKSSANPENGMKFINFLQEPENMAREMEMMFYDTFNDAAKKKLDPEFAKQFDVPEGANLVLSVDIPAQVRSQMDELWTEVKLS